MTDVVSPQLQKATSTFEQQRHALIEQINAQTFIDGITFCERLTEITDRWLHELFQHTLGHHALSHCMIYALGGYGRRQLCLQSDLDLLIEVHDSVLLDDPNFEHGIEQLMWHVRQTRIKLAHAVRSVEQGHEQLTVDPRTPIALLDARCLHQGQHTDQTRSVDAQKALTHLRGEDQGISFVKLLMEGHLQRRARHGKTVYLLEPDIKSGPGGLRDVHTVMWAYQVRWQSDLEATGWEASALERHQSHLSWLLWLRNQLHLRHKRKNDRLRFHDQEAIGAIFCQQRQHEANTAAKMVEALMQHHYKHARDALHQMERVLRQSAQATRPILCALDERFGHDDQQLHWRGTTPMTPADVFDALRLASQEQLRLEATLERQLLEMVQHMSTDEHQQRFYQLLTHQRPCQRTAQRLLDLGILAKMMPEFEPIVCHVQHDLYHVYTTDQHTIYCVELARTLIVDPPEACRWPAFAHIAREIKDPEMLILAALTHDIGKNRGGDHSNKGAQMAPRIGQRLGLSPQKIEKLAFLIREHLCLSKTARRRDISDTSVIRQLAHNIKTVNTLNTLTALTFCDMSTVSPNVMNDWNAALLLQLHRRIRTSIEHGIEHLWKQFERETFEKRAALHALEIEADQRRADQLDAFLRTISTEMIATASVQTLWHLFETYERCLETGTTAQHVFFDPEHGLTQWIIATPDQPGILARMAGALSASGLNILTAEVTSTASGHALDFFRVNPQYDIQYDSAPTRHEPLSAAKVERVRQTITQALEDGEHIEALIDRRRQSQALMSRHQPSVEAEVRVYQDVSDDFTVLEIKATDRPGLLYAIAKILHHHGINTYFSKIDSHGNTIVDTFYVEDGQSRQKLSASRVETLTKGLLEALRPSADSQHSTDESNHDTGRSH